MRASSGTSSESSSSVALIPQNSSEGSAPPPSEAPSTFEDVLQQQGGAASKPTDGPAPTQKAAPSCAAPVALAAGTAAKDSEATMPAADAAEKSKSTAVFAGSDLSAMMVHAAVLASNLRQTSAAKSPSDTSAEAFTALGKELPLLGLLEGRTGSLAREKKSVSARTEGNILQPGTATSGGAPSLPGGMISPLTGGIESSAGQQLTSVDQSENPPLGSFSGSASSLAGTTNVEKEKAMNADQIFPEILPDYGANNVSQQKAPDMQIQLGSNNDFEDALKQVMHVAQLTQTNESRTPMRVEMEIQTPPGAIVNVYVSRQNDQWRAQLSTNDPQALSWVQDKMSSLRQSSDPGVEIRWLPPQMESGSSPDSHLSWDRGGQGHQNPQQPDERSQSERQKKAGVVPRLAGILSNQFADAIQTMGRAA